LTGPWSWQDWVYIGEWIAALAVWGTGAVLVLTSDNSVGWTRKEKIRVCGLVGLIVALLCIPGVATLAIGLFEVAVVFAVVGFLLFVCLSG
jgi:hypothetical protein